MDPYSSTNHRLNTLSMKGKNIAVTDKYKTGHTSLVYTSETTTVLEKRTDRGKCNQYPSVAWYPTCIENQLIQKSSWVY